MEHSIEGRRLLAEFQFLVDRFGFTQSIPTFGAGQNLAETDYTCAPLRIETSYNPRDGHNVSLAYPSRGPHAISVGVLASSLFSKGDPAEIPSPDNLRLQSDFVRSHLDALLKMPLEVYEDCRALRFYHSANWRNEWGRAIVMDAATIPVESARLDRLRRYFAA